MQLKSFENFSDPAPLRSLVNARQAVITQTGPGVLIRRADLLLCGATALYRSEIGAPSVSLTQVSPESVSVLLPVCWQTHCTVNGAESDTSSAFLLGPGQAFHVAGASRVTLSAILGRDRFVRTVAALRGVEPEDAAIDFCVLRIGRSAGVEIRRRLSRVLDGVRSGRERRGPAELEHEILEPLIDASLHGSPARRSESSTLIGASRIVRAAEDRFVAAGADPVSLADLCAAAGVGKTTIYRAFDIIVGETPLGYFKKRRLTDARRQLFRCDGHRGAVKRAALGAGLTELGRFAAEYRELFGELPSATVTGSPPG